MSAVLEVEPCAWLVGRGTYWRPCGHDSTCTVSDGRTYARVCGRHRVRALERGWHDEPEP